MLKSREKCLTAVQLCGQHQTVASSGGKTWPTARCSAVAAGTVGPKYNFPKPLTNESP